jgi:hypothetical protein
MLGAGVDKALTNLKKGAIVIKDSTIASRWRPDQD